VGLSTRAASSYAAAKVNMLLGPIAPCSVLCIRLLRPARSPSKLLEAMVTGLSLISMGSWQMGCFSNATPTTAGALWVLA